MSMLDLIRKNELFSFPLYDITRNKVYKKYYKFFEESAQWNKEQIDMWQFKKIVSIIDYAYNHVKFYHQLYHEHGFEPGDLKSWKDFELLPYIDKETVKKYEEEFYSDEKDQMAYRIDYTGGSTGQPMRFLIDDEIYQREDALYRYYWRQIGFKVGEKCIVLRGRKIYTENNKKIYEFNRFWNYMYLDSLNLNLDFFKLYDTAIKKFDAKVIQAYPSSLYMLAKLYDVTDTIPPCFSVIMLGSENIDDYQLAYIKKIFQCDHIYNQYGHSEKIVLALQIPEGKNLGVVPVYGYTELVDSTGGIIKDFNKSGEIVGTGFSKSMPFIRYRTGDRSSYVQENCEGYMRDWKKFGKIEGRLHEYVQTDDNRLVSICTIGGAHISELNKILDMQYEQFQPGELYINILENPQNRLSNEDVESIEKKYANLFNDHMKCIVKKMNNIERTSRNKKKMLIQHISERKSK